jgi:hypothetical protein
MDMKKHLPSADLEKLGKILEIKEAYQRGDISLEEGRTRIREQIGEIRPYEIALAEQELKTIEENECRKEDIQKMIELFDEALILSELCLFLPDHVSKLPPEVDKVFKDLSEEQKHSFSYVLVPSLKEALGS